MRVVSLRFLRRCALVLALVVAGVLVTVAEGQSSPAALPTANLVQNPGGEAIAGAPDESTVVAPPDWTTTGQFTEVQYGASGGFPDAAASAAIDGGMNFFGGGNDPVSTATQVVDVSPYAATIDAGGAQATLDADLGGYDSQDDSSTVMAVFLDASGAQAGSPVVVGPVTSADRGGQTIFVPRSATAPVPAGTRQIRVVITATRQDGSYNDGYTDNVSLALSAQGSAVPLFPPLPPPVLDKSVNVQPVSGVVLVKLPATPGAARSAASKGSGFIPLAQARQIPVGSLLDTTRGTVSLYAAPATAGTLASGNFNAGIFEVLQARRMRGLTQLQLQGGPPRKRVCASSGKGRATAALSQRVLRLLKSSVSGRFATRGTYSSATVQGTQWTTIDRCDGTLTIVQRGSVVVTDFRRKRTIVLTAGKRYLARAP